MHNNQNNHSNQSIDNTNITFKNRLIYDKLVFYYISLPLVLMANLLGALLLAAIQLNHINIKSISVWLSLSVIMFLYGIYQYNLFRKESEENKLKHSDIWLDKYYTNTLIYGIIWGSSAFLMFPETGLLNQMIVLFFLFAIGFTSMGILASKRDLLITYSLVTYFPIILRLFFMEEDKYLSIAYVAISLMLIMIIIANHYGNIINNSLSNRHDFVTIKYNHEILKERFFSLFERAPVGIFYYNEQLELEDINQHFMQMHQIQNKEELIGSSLHALVSSKIIQTHHVVFEGKTGNYRGPFESKNNKNLYVKLSTVPMFNSDNKIVGGISILNDITQEITVKEEMVRNAYYDLLTNIPNRTLFIDNLTSFLERPKMKLNHMALLFLDINNFKKINETCGHETGDNLLKQVAQKLETFIGKHEIFARITGDKFVIFLPSLSTDDIKAKKETIAYIDILNQYFDKPFNLPSEEYHLNFSIGISLFKHEVSAYDALNRAEAAMYAAKKNVKGSYAFYEENISVQAREILSIENDIHKALTNNEFTINYQPQLDIRDNHIIGAEVLVRWEHPMKGWISPAVFIPIAEESGLIIKLEEWILDAAFKDIKKIFQTKQSSSLRNISVNISSIHFMQPAFIEKLMLLIKKYDLRPEWIELELTESGLIHNIDTAIEKIKDLKAFGFTFSIDDFGTGYSSLSYLKNLPVDTVKIDQSFIFNMHKNKGDAMIVESVVAIGQKFNLKIIAEGVETTEALAYLKNIKCDTYQGYLLHKPMKLDDFMNLI